jgi:very-short-patch-repair endonuclease
MIRLRDPRGPASNKSRQEPGDNSPAGGRDASVRVAGSMMFSYCSLMGVVRSYRAQLLQRRARNLRGRDTDAEARLWAALRDRRLGGWKWRRQVPVGPYIADFLCLEAGLVIELDGGQHADRIAYDARRTSHLNSLGLHVIRFWNSQVLTNRAGVCFSILQACGGDRAAHQASPAPSRGRGSGEGRLGWLRMSGRGPSDPQPIRPLPHRGRGSGEGRLG